MSDTQNPNPTTAEQRRALIRDFITKKTQDIRIEGQPQPQDKIQVNEPSRIVQANADGSLKPEPPPTGDRVDFRAYPDGTFCKFSELKDKPGFIAICLNSSKPGEPDVLHQVGIVKSRAVADMLCDGVNCLMQLKLAEQQLKQAEQQVQQAGELVADSLPPAPEIQNPETT